jgi:molybdenum cofactor biosynthesis protein A
LSFIIDFIKIQNNRFMITDNFGRQMNYLRVAVTDKCNLRCTYCMPHENMVFLPKNEILSYEELLRIISIFSDLGVNKVRFTGGEPFVRADFMDLLEYTATLKGIDNVNITTNGVLTYSHLEKLKEIKSLNLNISLDTLVPEKFIKIARRNAFNQVMKTIEKSIAIGIRTKINMVVQNGINDDEIIDFVEYFRNTPINLRFIEQMPFNETSQFKSICDAEKIKAILSANYELEQLPFQKNRTTTDYKIDSGNFTIGIIAGYTRNFCNTCNRIRLTSTGQIKTCLYSDPGLDVRELLRNGSSDKEIAQRLTGVVQNRLKDGKEAEKNRKSYILESMSKIGG